MSFALTLLKYLVAKAPPVRGASPIMKNKRPTSNSFVGEEIVKNIPRIMSKSPKAEPIQQSRSCFLVLAISSSKYFNDLSRAALSGLRDSKYCVSHVSEHIGTSSGLPWNKALFVSLPHETQGFSLIIYNHFLSLFFLIYEEIRR